jgi:hypothetical protein
MWQGLSTPQEADIGGLSRVAYEQCHGVDPVLSPRAAKTDLKCDVLHWRAFMYTFREHFVTVRGEEGGMALSCSGLPVMETRSEAAAVDSDPFRNTAPGTRANAAVCRYNHMMCLSTPIHASQRCAHRPSVRARDG